MKPLTFSVTTYFNNHKGTLATLIIFCILVIFWIILFLLYDPQEIVKNIGIRNSYLIIFSLAVLGAFTTLTTVSIYPALVTFALGNLNPVILILLAGIGLSLGDMIFFYFGYKARKIVSSGFRKKLDKFLAWLEEKPKWMIPVLLYLYIGFTPFPNNVLTGTLSISGYSFKKVVVPVILGDISLPIILVLLASRGIELF